MDDDRRVDELEQTARDLVNAIIERHPGGQPTDDDRRVDELEQAARDLVDAIIERHPWTLLGPEIRAVRRALEQRRKRPPPWPIEPPS
jgi:hypothetical protein